MVLWKLELGDTLKAQVWIWLTSRDSVQFSTILTMGTLQGVSVWNGGEKRSAFWIHITLHFKRTLFPSKWTHFFAGSYSHFSEPLFPLWWNKLIKQSTYAQTRSSQFGLKHSFSWDIYFFSFLFIYHTELAISFLKTEILFCKIINWMQMTSVYLGIWWFAPVITVFFFLIVMLMALIQR